MMDYSAENLERVVTVFYRSEAGQQAQAHQWLTEAQNSPQAWSFVWDLLQPHRSSEVQFFAATTLHTKLLKHWNEVPPDHYEQLKKKIVENIINYAMGPKIVLNRLCIALSAYIIHTIPTHWPNAFEELVASFQPQNLPNIESERVVWILLEILTVVPEEFQSSSLANTQKSRVRGVLQQAAPAILSVVELCLAERLATSVAAARCAGAWLGSGAVCVSQCGALAASLVQLVCRVYWQRAPSAELSGDELELVEAATEALGAVMAHPQTHKFPSIVTAALQDMLTHLVKVCEAEAARPPAEQSRDVTCGVWGVIVATADTHCKLLVSRLAAQEGDALALGVARAVLACTAASGRYPLDEAASALTFGFWYTLQDDALALEGAGGARALRQLQPLYRGLVRALLLKARLPTDSEAPRYSADERELLRCYRQDVADTLMYCHSVLHGELLALLDAQLGAAMAACAADSTQWPAVESCLHAYYAVAEAVDAEDAYVGALMGRLRALCGGAAHVRVLATALDTLGAYAEWLAEHPGWLGGAVACVGAGLSERAVAASATMALKDLAHACQRLLAPHAPPLLQAAHAALQSGELRLAECARLMFSSGKLLSLLPAAAVLDYLNVALAPYLAELQALLAAQPAVPATATAIASRLKLLSALFCALHLDGLPIEEPQPTLVVVQCTMPLYQAVAAQWCEHAELMEVLCTLLKHVVTTLGEASAPLTADLAQLLGAAYRAAPHACVLHVAKPLLLLWGRAMAPLLADLTTVTLATCAAPGTHQPDVLEAFFLTMAQLAKKSPRLLLAPGVDAAAIFQCAAACLALPELQVLKAAAAFLTAVVAQSREISLGGVVLQGGEQLVGRVLLNLGGAAPRSAVEPMAELLLALNKKYCDSLARWLHGFLARDDDFPSPKISRAQKEHFVKTVLREKANKRKLTESVLEFTLICRGILRPETSPA